jgi:hypothetical protein
VKQSFVIAIYHRYQSHLWWILNHVTVTDPGVTDPVISPGVTDLVISPGVTDPVISPGVTDPVLSPVKQIP